MKTLTVAAQKGGAGKSTIAVHLAVAAEAAGLKVALIDADPQGSVAAWAGIRGRPPLVAHLAPAEVRRGVEAARQDGFDLTIVDTAPHAHAQGALSLEVADLILVPTRPGAFDLAAVPAVLELIHAAKKPALMVLSMAPVRAAEINDALRALRGTGHPVAEAVIHDRVAFRRSLAHGQAVAEFENEGTASREMRALWHEVARRLDLKLQKRYNAKTL